jgi:hypothetical protein
LQQPEAARPLLLVGDEAAAPDLDDSRVQPARELAGVRRNQHRCAFSRGGDEQLDDVLRPLRIEVAGRLVGQQQLRLPDGGPGDGQSPALSRRELGWVGARAASQPGSLQLSLGASASFRAWEPHVGQLQSKGDVLERCPLRDEQVVLGDDPDPPAQSASAAAAAGMQRDAVDENLTGRRPDNAGKDLEQACLAGAGRSDEERQLARSQLQPDAVEGAQIAVAQREPLGANERRTADRGRQRRNGRRQAPEQVREDPHQFPYPSDE